MTVLGAATRWVRHLLAPSGGKPAQPRDSSDKTGGYYGRRVEKDRTWTVYHVFTGVPARIAGKIMMRLTRSDATDRMLKLNKRNQGEDTLQDPPQPNEVVRK
jgi:hypothetical protein